MFIEVKMEGFDLLSKESVIFQGKNANMEGDSWVCGKMKFSFTISVN